jgi:hypothetical protein
MARGWLAGSAWTGGTKLSGNTVVNATNIDFANARLAR